MPSCLYVVPTICDPLVSQPIAACIKNSTSFKGLDFVDHSDGKSSLRVDILIGSIIGSWSQGVCVKVCRWTHSHTYSKLGWVLSGTALASSHSQCLANLVTTHVLRVDVREQENMSLDEQLRSFWELESLGIQEVKKTLYDDFASNLVFSQGRSVTRASSDFSGLTT